MSIIKFLANLSPARIWNLLSNPAMLPVWLGAPRSAPVFDVARFAFESAPLDQVEALCLEFLRDQAFFGAVNERMIARRKRHAHFDTWMEALYVLVRLRKPEVIVETGVFDGTSSAVILLALAHNGTGNLISIDLPATDAIESSTDRMQETSLPPGCQPGWVIPDRLRERHTLLFGDSRILLPQVLQEHGTIDIFLHDSLHTFEHQFFEYSTVWPHLSRGGLLLSDDIFWNAAYHRFCAKQGRPYSVHNSLGVCVKD